MNAYQPRTTPSYGYDSTYSSFESTGMPIFGCDSSAGRFTALNLEASAGNVAKFRQFTGKERDSELGLDYFGARYHGSALGRWTSPDSINLTDSRLLSPTNTLNKYVYGANNPLRFVDPDGKDVVAFYDHGGIAGHSMVLAYNQDTGDYAIKDYGPAHGNGGDTGDRLIELAGGKISGVDDYSVRNVSSPQDLRDHYSSLTIQTIASLVI